MPLPSVQLTAHGLTKRYGRNVLFRELDLSVGAGEALAVTGPNGSGKSTLLMLLAGLLTPSAGRVELSVDGRTLDPDDQPRRVGFVGPYLQLYEHLTARENMAFLARARRLPNAEALVSELLDRVGLAGKEDGTVKTYSSGMRQRARFAAALLAEPPILLLDEPGSNLDEAGRAFVRSMIETHRTDGGAVVIATNVEDEAALCDARVVLGG